MLLCLGFLSDVTFRVHLQQVSLPFLLGFPIDLDNDAKFDQGHTQLNQRFQIQQKRVGGRGYGLVYSDSIQIPTQNYENVITNWGDTTD